MLFEVGAKNLGLKTNPLVSLTIAERKALPEPRLFRMELRGLRKRGPQNNQSIAQVEARGPRQVLTPATQHAYGVNEAYPQGIPGRELVLAIGLQTNQGCQIKSAKYRKVFWHSWHSLWGPIRKGVARLCPGSYTTSDCGAFVGTLSKTSYRLVVLAALNRSTQSPSPTRV